jgi:beta-galactosidase
VLKDALGLGPISGGAPFEQDFIRAFGYRDVPVSFLETYSGDFNEVFAEREGGGVTGFIKTLGAGKVMMLGAAFAANTLGDLDIVQKMALKMGCVSPFALSEWADVRLSRAERGSFLFINNYLDDPIETTIAYAGHDLLAGNPVRLPARRGAILPLNWQVRENVTLHFATSEINAVVDEGATLTLKSEQPDFVVELTLTGYACEGATPGGEAGRVRARGHNGAVVLKRAG